MKVLTNSTSIALWQDIIQEAETQSGIPLNEDLESYLIFLLMRYLNRPEITKQVIASDYLQSLKLSTSKRLLALQEVGDKCLLFSGLFPHMAEKRLVKISYFVNLGQSAYGSVSARRNDLFGSLAKHFVMMMDVLQTLHVDTPLTPIEAYDLWNETSSRHAYEVLKKYANGVPVGFQYMIKK